MKNPEPAFHAPTKCNGSVVPDAVVTKIRAMLVGGEHPQLASIAKRCGVTSRFVKAMLDNDPELNERFRDSLQITGEQIEKSAIEMCQNDELNPIARQKMIEFMLPKLMPEKYGENAGLGDAAKNLPKICVSLTLPVIEKKEEVIEVKSESPLDGK